jgi:Glycosyltransferase sugar-binding region containing DXD motif
MFKYISSYSLLILLTTFTITQASGIWPGEWISIAAPYSQCCMPAQYEKLLIIEQNDELIGVTTHSNDAVCESMGLESGIYEMRYPWNKDQKDFKPDFISQMNERVNSRFTYIGQAEYVPEGASLCMEIETNQSTFGGRTRCPYLICRQKEGHEIFINRSAMVLEGSFHEGMSYGEEAFDEYFRDDAKKTYRTLFQMYEVRKFSLAKCFDEPLIPPKIHTIWMGVNKMPAPSMFRVAEWKRLHPLWEFKIWNDTDIEDLVKPYLSFFKKLRTDAMRVDFVRLLILRDEGGLFVELDVLPKKNYDDLICRYDYFTGVSFAFGHYTKHMIEINVLGVAKNHTLINSNIKSMLETIDIKLKKFDTTFYSIYLRDNHIKNLNWIEPTRGPYHLLAMTVMMFSYTYTYWLHHQEVNRSILLPRYYHNPYSDFYDMPYAHSEHYVWKNKPLKPILIWDEAIKNYTLVTPIEQNKYNAFREKYNFAPLVTFPFQSHTKIPQILHLFTNSSSQVEQDWLQAYSHFEINRYELPDDNEAYCKKLEVVSSFGGFAVSGHVIRPMFIMNELSYKLDFFGSLDPEFENVVISDKIFGAKPDHKIIKNAFLKDCINGLATEGKSLTNSTYQKIYLSREDLILPSYYFFCDKTCDINVRNISFTELRF